MIVDSKKYIVISGIVVGLLVAILSGVYLYKKSKTDNGISPVINQATSTQVAQGKARAPLSTVSTDVKRYVDYLKTTIPTVSDKDDATRGKIIYYALLPATQVTDGSPEKDKLLTESFNGFYTMLGERSDPTDPLYTRVRAVIFNTYESNCFLDDAFEASSFVNDPVYIELNKKYKGKVVKFLYMNTLLENIPENTDRYYASSDIRNLATILDNFEGTLSQEDKKNFIERLKKRVTAYPSLPLHTNIEFKTGQMGNTEWTIPIAETQYSYGYQVLSKFDSTITKDDVIKNYESKLKFLDDRVEKNKNMVDVTTRDWLILAYSGYLYENNGNVVDDSIKRALGTFMAMSSADFLPAEYAAKETFFLMNAQKSGGWDQVKVRAFKVTDKYPEWKQYLEKRGLKFNGKK